MGEFDSYKAAMSRACTNKVRYDSKQSAKRFAKALSKKFSVKYYPYKCDYCHQWHLTTGHGDVR